MPTQSPRTVAGFAMLSLGFFDGIIGVTWLAAHQSFGVSIESLGWVLGAMGLGSAVGSAMAPVLLRRIDHLRALFLSLAVQLACMLLVGLSATFFVFIFWYGLRGLANGVAHASLNAFFAPRISSRHLMNVHGGWGVGTASAGLVSGLLLVAEAPWFGVYLIGAVLTAGALGLVGMSLKHFADWEHPMVVQGAQTPRLIWPLMALMLAGGLYVGLEQGVGNWLSALLVATVDANVSEVGVATAVFWGSLTGGRFLLTWVRGSEEQILVFAAAVVLGALLLAPWLPLTGQVLCYGLVGLAMAPIAPFTLTVVSRRVAPERRDHIMSWQILVFSAGAACVPFGFGSLAWVLTMDAIAWGFVGVATLLLVLFSITVGWKWKGI